ncbi:hypothetical protein [Bifidobacterium crudilactis]|uniref:hypothetical protein n=1 Tax=Bifidobacterium crudilactis TaxID=327277 RepID=UPI00264937D3|nr:hypothetical protein [Bifidobacterium crudilactis]MDN5973537.1 hypothetical protein [Bifidobacterium crudilactis]MDN6271670.1 hypothetical protein [Bifidobacterium crudilactis]MDN6459007.1 hypothetical protein [Bifidobacterium crudilactis]MDN6773420.1 hypothetical protein [Bifidobacterium crudilactis]
MSTIKRLRIKYETATGLESPSLREVGEEGINSVDYGYDFVLRGEVEGWPSRNFTIGDYLLDELREDVNNAQ